jgi:hypothetical protein
MKKFERMTADVGRRFIHLLLLVVVIIAIGACTHAVPLSGSIESLPSKAKAPIKIGVYYGPDIQTYQHEESEGGDSWVFPLGPTSVNLLDKAFYNLFEETIRVDRLPPLEPGSKDVAAVIEARIESFYCDIPFLKTSNYTAEIAYRFILSSLKGDPVASWVVTGFGSKPGEFGFDFARWPGEATDLAMQDAMKKFVTGFQDVPEARRWLGSL